VRIYVTGASGYIGRALCRRLADDGHEVRALVRSPERARPLAEMGVATFAGDVTDLTSLREGMSGADLVVHAAADLDLDGPPGRMEAVNVTGSANVASLAHKLGVPRLLSISSVAWFGGSPDDGTPADESAAPRLPLPTPYSDTKHRGELAIRAYAARGLEVVTVYPSLVYGPPGKKEGANALLRQLWLGRFRRSSAPTASPPGSTSTTASTASRAPSSASRRAPVTCSPATCARCARWRKRLRPSAARRCRGGSSRWPMRGGCSGSRRPSTGCAEGAPRFRSRSSRRSSAIGPSTTGARAESSTGARAASTRGCAPPSTRSSAPRPSSPRRLLSFRGRAPSMFTVFKDYTFAAGHAIRGHTGGCQHLHGHNYRVRVHVAAERLDALGMVIDFADLKRIVEEVLGPFDHRVINDLSPFDERNTTAELLAQYVHDEVAPRLPAGRRVQRVEVWETETSCAVYEP
jgi:6-pyruvoyltetrahydropterin/6-carboxytetrahydropterin synthase